MRKIGIIVIFVVQACSANKYLPVSEITYSDGVNESEAKSLANDYIEKNKTNICQNIYIYQVKDIKDDWKVELGCDTNAGILLSPYDFNWHRGGRRTVFRDGGVLLVKKSDGSIVRTFNKKF